MERFFTMMVTAKIRAEISDYCKIVFSYSNEQNSKNRLLSLFDNNTVLDNDFLMNYVNNEFYNAELTAYAFVEKMEHGSDDERIDRQEAHSNMALRNRLKNRLILLYGSPEIVDCRNEIERHILSIEKNVISYQTVDEIKRASRIMLYVTELYSPSNEDLTEEEYKYNKAQFYNCTLGFLNPDKRRYFFGAINIDKYFVLSERPEELIEAEKAFFASKSILNDLYNGKCYSAYQKIVLSDEAKKYFKLKKEYFVFKEARDIIIKELYGFGIVTIGNNRKSVKIFGLDGELYNMKISYVNSYSTREIVITDIKFDEDVQKVLDAIEKK